MKGLNPSQNRQLRVDVHAMYGGRCAYCDVSVRLRAGTVDHYLPKALGGTNARRNLRWCCWACNQAKADMHPDEWEQRRPVLAPRRETRAEVRCRLLSEIARKGRALAISQARKEVPDAHPIHSPALGLADRQWLQAGGEPGLVHGIPRPLPDPCGQPDGAA